jgi:hypothetical protein
VYADKRAISRSSPSPTIGVNARAKGERLVSVR